MIGPLEIVIILLVIASLWGAVLAGMKGHWVWLVLGILFAPLGLVGFALTPKPGSHKAQQAAEDPSSV